MRGRELGPLLITLVVGFATYLIPESRLSPRAHHVLFLITGLLAIWTLAVGYRAVRRRWIVVRVPVVTIDSPEEGQEVGLHETARGAINPPGPLSVFVLANNGFWYRQRVVNSVGPAWNAGCTFGDAKSKKGIPTNSSPLQGSTRQKTGCLNKTYLLDRGQAEQESTGRSRPGAANTVVSAAFRAAQS
jgi:hypothetical protein